MNTSQKARCTHDGNESAGDGKKDLAVGIVRVKDDMWGWKLWILVGGWWVGVLGVGRVATTSSGLDSDVVADAGGV